MADDQEQWVWQYRANQLQSDLMRAQIQASNGDRLPVLRWTIQSAGCVSYAEPGSRDDAGKAAAVQAWADHLGLEVRRAPMGDGWTRLTAHGTYERVTVAVSATLYGDGDGEDRG